MAKERLHIDMDHCAVDFEKGKREWLQRFPNEAIPHAHMEYWINLEPMPGFLKHLSELEKDFDVYLLTAPSLRNRACWTGKAIWVFNNLGPEYLPKLITSYDKGQYSGAYLIDDGDQNGQVRYNGEHIQFGHSEGLSTWEGVVKYIQENYKPKRKASIPKHFKKDAESYIEERVNQVEEIISQDELEDLVNDGIRWALKKMKQSYPTEERVDRGHSYTPPFYRQE